MHFKISNIIIVQCLKFKIQILLQIHLLLQVIFGNSNIHVYEIFFLKSLFVYVTIQGFSIAGDRGKGTDDP